MTGMTHQRLRSLQTSLLVLCLMLVSASAAGLGQRQRARSPRQAEPHAASTSPAPKLVVVIVVDQFRYDLLERFWDLYRPDGFRKLVTGGAFFTNANFDYVPTVTAAGHAAVHTGSVPARNGIVGNYLFDRKTRENPFIVFDPEMHPVTSAGEDKTSKSASPHALIGTTLGDQLRARYPQSKVVAMAGKDRSAILPGGWHSNGVYWYAKLGDSGEFVSSSFYFKGNKQLPQWVRDFDQNPDTRPDKKYFTKEWKRAKPPAAYERSMSEHIPEQQRRLCPDNKDCGFPYKINKDNFEYTPFASDYLAEFAKAAIVGEPLGEDSFPDLLAISFSQPDLLGHAYGPDSQEIEDTYIQLDSTLADFLNFIEKGVGLRNTIVVLTADHGVAPIPKYVNDRGFDARVIDFKEIKSAVNKALRDRFKLGDDDWVLGFSNEQLYLNRKLMEDVARIHKGNAAQIEREAAKAAVAVDGMANAFTRTQILSGRMPASALARRVTNGYLNARGGDLWLVTKPWCFIDQGLATTHGSPYDYDTHVPMILFGAGVRPGRYSDVCTPSDIAPTIASMLGISPPSQSVGRVLVEALAEKGKSASAH